MICQDTVAQAACKPEPPQDVYLDLNSRFGAVVNRSGCVALLCYMLCGCTMLNENLPLLKKSDKPADVQRILTMWTFSSQEEPDGSKTPGFVGKILFFEAGSDKPVEASGYIEIQVHEQQAEEWRLRRKFVSEPDVWKRNARQTALGTVYDVFVPHETLINQRYSLVLKYRSLTGQFVSSPQSQLP